VEIVRNIAEMQRWSEARRRKGQTIGLVPTMGFFHEGHLSLIRAAKKTTDVVVTSLFVNPTQFGPTEDFQRYPRDPARDAELAEKEGTDILFMPDSTEIYPAGYSTFVSVDTISSIFEGHFRPTHFRGVTTIVCKLFLITKPHFAFFGQKDAQQCAVVKMMVRDLNFDISIIVQPTVREADGLAMSSRNVYLSHEQRAAAPVLFRALKHAETLILSGVQNSDRIVGEMKAMISSAADFRIDYLAVVDPERFDSLTMTTGKILVLIVVAARIGTTRLIDNILISLT
jgi:pantoate--beta-alanine ligase